MHLPPTPPDEKTQQPGYVTPPNAFDPLTPDTTPRRMPAVSNNVLSHLGIPRMESPLAPATSLATSPLGGGVTQRNDEEKAAEDSVGTGTRIPGEEMNTTKYMQGTASPRAQRRSPGLQPQQLRIRKKRRQVSSGGLTAHPPFHNMASDAANNTEWLDAPPDNVGNEQLYRQIRHSKMERLEAIDDGTAIEAMIVPTEAPKDTTARSRNGIEPVSIEQEASQPHGLDTSERRLVSAPLERTTDALEPTVRKLRHERRPLSSGRTPTSGLAAERRHVSLPLELRDTTSDSMSRNLRRVSKDSRLENAHRGTPESNRLAPYDASPSISYSALSPSIKSHRFANTQTPMSGISDRTEMELCEAKNVTLFTHSNDSVLLINHAAKKPQVQQHATRTLQPLSYPLEDPESSSSSSSGSFTRSLSTPEIQVNGNLHTADSPLTNPRAAPLPPAIQFIPPTPSIDDERQTRTQNEAAAQAGLQRSGSLMRTARRLSDTILTPLFSRSNSYKHISKPQHIVTAESDRLHPMWMPNSMWHDDDDTTSDEEYDDHHDRLPAGGDTSAHPVKQSRSTFPRKMSVRMPGFRGRGGFLQGNSLGVERHGSNKRRHYVEMPAKRQGMGTGFLQSMKKHMKDLELPGRGCT
ncbi:hypothetical protein AMS68_004998 [Peltaster fructicola]|uniref:Uncharacterized protein n=1 Tax=Peltaster fructicola TaxID=286661 RepID=A0A6H0XXT8_9PEZI|nr:hypothetical protein AMS68_004998 [Peltaster fructicola]